MNEIEKLLEKIEVLTRRVDQLESQKPSTPKREVETAGLDFICNAEDIAHLWGCSVESVRNRAAGTGAIKRLPGRFIRATKREVMAALNRRNLPASEVAAKYFSQANVRPRRKSLIKRT